MSSEIYGLEDVLKDLEMTSDEIDEAMDEISKEVATEILDEAIENVNGPHLGSKTSRKKLKIVDFEKQPYPIAVRTGNLKRSLKIKKLGKNSYKVFADMAIANYACWVHDGTGKMKERPFLDDAVRSVLDSKKYLDIAGDIIDEILNK